MPHLSRAILLSLLSLLPLFGRAERVSVYHIFNKMFTATPPTLTVQSGNTVGVTDLLTYTCSSGASFNYYNTQLCICLPNGKSVTTTVVEDLAEMQIYYYYASSVDCSKINVYVASEGGTWTLASTIGTVACNSVAVSVQIPHDAKSVKIENKTGKDIYIPQIYWFMDCCNCFSYESE